MHERSCVQCFVRTSDRPRRLMYICQRNLNEHHSFNGSVRKVSLNVFMCDEKSHVIELFSVFVSSNPSLILVHKKTRLFFCWRGEYVFQRVWFFLASAANNQRTDCMHVECSVADTLLYIHKIFASMQTHVIVVHFATEERKRHAVFGQDNFSNSSVQNWCTSAQCLRVF